MDSRSKLWIAIGLFVVVAAVAAIYFLAIRPGGEPAAPSVARAPEEEAPAPGPAPAAAPEAAPPARAEPAAAAALTGSQEPYRADPFKAFPLKYIPPLPPVPLALRLPVAVSLARLSPTTAIVAFRAPTRRVAGLLRDGRVWAIYEAHGQTSVVKPGDIVEGGMVQAITDDGLVLQMADQPEPILVPLQRGAPRSVAPAAAPTQSARGLPGRAGASRAVPEL